MFIIPFLIDSFLQNSDSTAANAGNDVDMSNSAAGSAASQPGSSSPPVNLSDVIAGERASETVRRNQGLSIISCLLVCFSLFRSSTASCTTQ